MIEMGLLISSFVFWVELVKADEEDKFDLIELFENKLTDEEEVDEIDGCCALATEFIGLKSHNTLSSVFKQLFMWLFIKPADA